MSPSERADVALLRKMSDKEFEFTKGAAMEKRAYSLTLRGLAEKRWEVYSYRAGVTQFRYAYRRTEAGRAAAS